jgi:biopolymer transport protein ExbB/TolQ
MNQEDFYKDIIFYAVILNSIGLVPMISFISSTWYNTKRNEERILELKQGEEKLKEQLKEINEQRHKDNENFAKIIYEMKITLNNLNSTLQTFSAKLREK